MMPSTIQQLIHRPVKHLSRCAVIGFVLALSCSPVFADTPTPTPTPAPTIVVNSTADDPGFCPDSCTLRAAIAAAKPDEVIGFADDLKGTISLMSALTIDKNLTLRGPGASVLAIDGGKRVPIFVQVAGQFTLSGFTIQNGKTPDQADGGAINVGAGNLTVTDCAFNGNVAVNRGGAIFGDQGSGVTIFSSTFTGNQAQGFGGAIYNNGGSLNIANSTLTDNIANYLGGGIDNLGGDLTITGSTFAKNIAGRNGGALEYGAGTITILNSSFANNASTGASGGAISDDDTAAESLVRISYSTIAFNTASSGKGGGINIQHATLTLNGSLIAQNTAQNSPDLVGKFKSGGYNLIGNSKNLTGLLGSDQHDLDPQLVPLALNAPGTTPTLALPAGSPAIVNGGTACPDTDQRGVKRKKTCDIGAYETDAAK